MAMSGTFGQCFHHPASQPSSRKYGPSDGTGLDHREVLVVTIGVATKQGEKANPAVGTDYTPPSRSSAGTL
jgi:hypothetical protein